MTTRKVFIRAGLAAGMALFAVACGKQEPPPAPKAEAKKEEPKKVEPLKVGFVYVSPVGDAGWTSQHYAGRLEME